MKNQINSQSHISYVKIHRGSMDRFMGDLEECGQICYEAPMVYLGTRAECEKPVGEVCWDSMCKSYRCIKGQVSTMDMGGYNPNALYPPPSLDSILIHVISFVHIIIVIIVITYCRALIALVGQLKNTRTRLVGGCNRLIQCNNNKKINDAG
jgi:hypothetical protein